MTLWELAARSRGRLRCDGVDAGFDVEARSGTVAMQPSGIEGVRAMLSVARGGGVIVPLHPASTDLARVAAECREFTSAAVAAVFYTSGSTGLPKGVLHTHESLVRCGQDIAAYLDIRPTDRVLGALPMAFHYGFSQLTSALAAHATLVLAPSTLPGDLLRLLDEERVTHAALVPGAWEYVVRAQEEARSALPALRVASCAGGGMRPALVRRFAEAFPDVALHRLYGTTEALRTLRHAPGDPAEGPGVLGRPVPGVGVRVMDGAQECADGEEGELVHAGAFVGLGYLGGEPFGAEVRTGDRAVRDAAGVHWFRGRADEVVKTGGFRVGPEEVEFALMDVPGVVDAIAFGVPDEVLGQVVEAACFAPGVSAATIRRAVELPPWAVPRRIRMSDRPLPRGPNGKLLRRAAR